MSGDDGNASIEFVLVSVVLLVPLVYVLLAVFELQRAAFAASAAAREAGRAYVTADHPDDAVPRARRAADVALTDQLGHVAEANVAVAGRLDAGTPVRVSVTVTVPLPFAGRWARVPVTATHTATVDRYR